jgi:hypothetical protein
VFSDLGRLEGNYKIHLKEDAVPYALSTPHHAYIFIGQVKEELGRMEEIGAVSKIESTTDWCAGMVVVPKSNGDIRVCVDMTNLNEAHCRERHILPSVEQSLAQMDGSRVFTKLDALSGFWQIPLSSESRALTTFITPLGRYCFNVLPF